MAYGDTFRVGDRIVLDNFEGPSFGTVMIERPNGNVDIKWDDGFDDATGFESSFNGYSPSEIDHVCRCVEPDKCFCPDYAKAVTA